MLINVENVQTKDSHVAQEFKQINKQGMFENKVKSLAREHKIQIIINEIPMYQVVCTPGDLQALVVGRLFSEGIVETMEEISSIFICESGERAKVFLNKELQMTKSRGQEVLSCCTDNKAYQAVAVMPLEPVLPAKWDYMDIFMLTSAFEGEMPLYEATHAVHSCFIATKGAIVYSSEDIGRHNALDKVIGQAIINHVDLSQCIVFTSGRVPTDMVSKVIRAHIPVLISKGAPTMDAVEMAQQFQLTLICNARRDNAIKYN